MKKHGKVAGILMVLLCVTAVFAQESAEMEAENGGIFEESSEVIEIAKGPIERKNAISLDLFPLFKGIAASENTDSFEIGLFALALAYERLIVPHFSIGAGIDAYFGNIETAGENMPLVYFSLQAKTRFYPLSESADKLFLGASIGFNLLSVDGETDRDESFGAGFAGFTAVLEAGYRLIIEKGFYVEPAISYVLSKAPMIAEGGVTGIPELTPLDWEGGLRIGFAF